MAPELNAVTILALPIALGLLGFVEPCSIGSTLVFIKYVEGRSRAAKIAQVAVFAGARAVFTGALGVAAVAIGSAFIGFQKSAWALLGALYVAMGLMLMTRRADRLMARIGPSLAHLSPAQGSATLGVLFGLNIPACAAPLVLALLTAAAAAGASGATYAAGFTALALFGLALSAPLVAALLFERVRRWLDRLAGLSRRMPFWAGLVLVLLGAWSIRFALVVEIAA